MPEPRVFKLAELPFKPAVTPTGSTSIARVIGSDLSRHLGAGIETIENAAIEWTVTYDEVLFVLDGELTIESAGRRQVCTRGDIVWLPNGTSLTYIATAPATYFYALHPVDWAQRQGIREP